MVRQYPYKLEVFLKTEAVYDPETGTFTPGTEEWKNYGKCRDEVNNSGTRSEVNSQIKYEYTWLIQCPKNLKEISIGATIRVIGKKGEVRMTGEVLRTKYDQLHARIWV